MAGLVVGRGRGDQVTGAVRHQVEVERPGIAGAVVDAVGGRLAAGERDGRGEITRSVGVSDVSVIRESAVVAYPESKDASGWSALPFAFWELAYSA